MKPFTLNCSRIGLTGGLRSFSEQAMEWLGDPADPLDAVLPSSIPAPRGVRKISTPDILGSASGVSLVRPIAWLGYSWFGFPLPRDRRILCTTQHVLPRHRHQIVTVHDLRPYFFPDSPLQRLYFHRMLPRALARCEGILTVSEASRQMLMEVYRLDGATIRVVPNAVELPTAMDEDAESAHGEPPYLLMVGASWAHKNAEEVLRMHRHWARSFRLKIVAGAGVYRERLRAMAAGLRISERVEFLSGVDRGQLNRLYAGCAALVYPSKMEGFGLPPLEAMAHGRRVIVSDIPVFRELYGSHARYVTLGEEGSWERAFRDLGEHDPENAARALAHAASFSRERMGEALDAALRYFWGPG